MDGDQLKILETRINTALDRIEARLAAPAPSSNGLADENRAQADEILALRSRLDEMKEARRRDADDVTAILADLRPLLEQ
ncbi:MAG: hypothetical protein AAGC92_10600 [Pseudomonadota bacterium]